MDFMLNMMDLLRLSEAVCGAAEPGGGKAARLDPRLKLV